MSKVMEPPSTLPEKRVRKRSKRLSETDSVSGETEPARKRAKRGGEVTGKKLQEVEKKRSRGSRDKALSSKVCLRYQLNIVVVKIHTYVPKLAASIYVVSAKLRPNHTHSLI